MSLWVYSEDDHWLFQILIVEDEHVDLCLIVLFVDTILGRLVLKLNLRKEDDLITLKLIFSYSINN